MAFRFRCTNCGKRVTVNEAPGVEVVPLEARGYLASTDRRFRPIMMTAITTIGGMVPLAFAGANSIGLSYTSFALTLIGGMTTATLRSSIWLDDVRISSSKPVHSDGSS